MAALKTLLVVALLPVSLLDSAAGQIGNRLPSLQETGTRPTSPSHHIAFPGSDAFEQISGIRNTTRLPSSTTRLPINSVSSPSNGYNGGNRAPPQTSSTSGLYNGMEENYQGCSSSFSWENDSPFYNVRRQQNQRLPDTRLAIETMFRMANKMESILREPGINLVYSPIGLTSTLGQLMLAARGETLTELENLLVPGNEACKGSAANKFHLSFQSLISQIWRRRGTESYELSTRNALFHQTPGQTLNQMFTKRLSVEYATEIFPTDFRNSPVFAHQQINGWASSASQGKIDQLLPHIPVRSTTAIISSITYFKGEWENKFNKKFTSTAPFYLDGDYRLRVKTIEYMKAEMELPYAESKSLGCRLVVMPYTNNETAMYLLMPLGSPKWKTRTIASATVFPSTRTHTYHSKDDLLSTRIAEAQNPVLEQVPVRNSYTNPYYVQAPTPIISNQYNYRNQGNNQPNSRSSNNVPVTRTYQVSLSPRTKRQTNEQSYTGSSQESADPCGTVDSEGSTSHPCSRSLTEGDSPFSPHNLHEIASRLGPNELTGLIYEAKRKSPERVSLIIPKLFMTTNVKLKDALTAMGVPSVFREDADLSGAIDDGRPSGGEGEGKIGQRGPENKWLVNEVWQQSRLEVTEDGTEAASGTAAGIVDYNLDSIIFKANSPFLSVIRHEATGAPIFWASVVNPT